MGSFKGHALPGSFFLVAGLWWTVKFSLWRATRRNKNMGSTRLASRSSQRRLEVIESAAALFFSLVGASVPPRVADRHTKFSPIYFTAVINNMSGRFHVGEL